MKDADGESEAGVDSVNTRNRATVAAATTKLMRIVEIDECSSGRILLPNEKIGDFWMKKDEDD